MILARHATGGVGRLDGHRARIRALPLVICALWGGNVVATAMAVADLPPFLAAAIRGGLATAALLAWACVQRADIHLQARQRVPIVALSLLNAGTFALLYLALGRTAATHVAVLLYLYPIFTAVLAHALLPGEGLSIRTCSGLALGFLGATATLSDSQPHAPPGALAGDVLAVGSAGLWALQAVYTKRVVSTTDPFSIVLYTTALSGLVFVGMSSIFESSVRYRWSWSALMAFGYQALVVDAASRLLWIRLMRNLHVTTLTTYTFFTPIFGLSASVLLLGERFSMRLLLGVMLVALALIAVERPVAAQAATDRSSRLKDRETGRFADGPPASIRRCRRR